MYGEWNTDENMMYEIKMKYEIMKKLWWMRYGVKMELWCMAYDIRRKNMMNCIWNKDYNHAVWT